MVVFISQQVAYYTYPHTHTRIPHPHPHKQAHNIMLACEWTFECTIWLCIPADQVQWGRYSDQSCRPTYLALDL